MEDWIREYVEGFEAKLATLRTLVADRDAAGVKTFGHRLKGSGATYGFEVLSEIGELLENAAVAVIDNARRRDARGAAAAVAETSDAATPPPDERPPAAVAKNLPNALDAGSPYVESSGDHLADAAAWADIESIYARLAGQIEEILEEDGAA